MTDESRSSGPSWLAFALLLAMASPALASVDLVCPLCEGPEPLSIAALLEVAIATVIRKGVALLLLAALVVVGLPWVLAGAAVALVHRPKGLRRDDPT